MTITADPGRDRLAGLRMLQLIPQYLAVGYAVHWFLMARPIMVSTEIMATWWTVIAVPATLLTGVLMGPLCWRAGQRRIQVVASLPVAGYLLALATWYFAWNGGDLASGRGFWLAQFPGLAILSAGLVMRARYACVVLLICGISGAVINYLIHSPPSVSSLIAALAWGIGFNMTFLAAELMVVRAANTLDATRSRAYQVAAGAAAADARTAERQRFGALTHDRVLATLLLAARRGASPELAHSARSALDAIDGAATVETASEVPATVAARQIRAVVADADPTQRVVVEASATARYPQSVIDEIAAATGEAVRNVVRHAGANPQCVVTVRARPDRVTVTVADEGCGFDPSAVAGSRLGIAASIVGRFDRVPGGRARVESTPGAGTRVHIEWRREGSSTDAESAQ